MISNQADIATQVCEKLLRDEQKDNREKKILASHHPIVERLLKRRLEMAEGYEDLYQKLHAHSGALETFFRAFLRTAAYSSPQEINKGRTGRDELERVNHEIAVQAAELARLLRQREDLHEHSRFQGNTHYHVCDVIEAATKRCGNAHFGSRVADGLDLLRLQSELEHWPSLGDLAEELAADAASAQIRPSDPTMAAATSSSRPSRADFTRALLSSIEESKQSQFGEVIGSGRLPINFVAADKTIAALVNCALDSGPGTQIDSDNVKGLRQRDRNR